MFTKAQKIKQIIDKVVRERNKCWWDLQNQIMKSHIVSMQKSKYIYEA